MYPPILKTAFNPLFLPSHFTGLAYMVNIDIIIEYVGIPPLRAALSVLLLQSS